MPVLTIVHHPDAPWLPAGGVAEVVLAGTGDEMPGPVGLARLLITDDAGRIFCVPRSGGRPGWDLPTSPVGNVDPAVVINDLTLATCGAQQPVVPVGAVRNVVHGEGEYEWPRPVAYFCVYRPTTSPAPVVDGVWLTPEEAAVGLSERHWWPLVTVDEEAVRALFEDLLITWGFWLSGADRDRARVVDSAVDALVAGLDSPSLRELAGVYEDASWSEIDNLILHVVDELGVPHPTEDRALRLDLRRRSAKVLAGQAEPIEFVAWGRDRVGYDGPVDLRVLTYLCAEYSFLEDVFPYWVVEDRREQMGALDAVVRDLAAAVVAGETDLSRFIPRQGVTDPATLFIEPFFRSLPLALPTMIGACALAVLGAQWWARWLQVPRTVAVVFVAVCGAYVGVTATPTGAGLWSNPGGSRGVSLDIQLPPLGNLLMISSDSLNLLAGASLGMVSVLMWCAGRRWMAVCSAVGLPLAVEVVQLLFPGMGRVGFLLTDVVVNWIGAGIGTGIAAAVVVVIGAAGSFKAVPE